MPPSVTCKAPASMMLFGEHSVLRKGKAVVAAVDVWLTVAIGSRNDDTVEVVSCFGKESCSLKNISLSPNLPFVRAALVLFSPLFSSGCSITITSDIDPTMGLGSSAAVSVAMITALSAWTEQTWSREKILKTTISLIRSVQGCGSGADVASIVYGGVIAFDGKTEHATALSPSLPLVAQYCGYKKPTPEVVSLVKAREKDFPEIFSSLFSSIDLVTNEALSAIQCEDLHRLGTLMNSADALLQALGVGTGELSEICWRFREEPTIFGAKISGSGLGDCAIALGASQQKCLPISVSPVGVALECL